MSKIRKSRTAQKTISKHNSNQVRIIAGQWRGRKLDFPSITGLRPTGDRMRETLFNWLGAYLDDARVVDLFAGSGSLGFEALSRNAQNADFVELDSNAAASIQHNLSLLAVNNANLHAQSAFDYLNTAEQSSCDILFIDPPFAKNYHNQILALTEEQRILRKNAFIYVEAPFNEPIEIPKTWVCLKEKTTGQVKCLLFQCQRQRQGQIEQPNDFV